MKTQEKILFEEQNMSELDKVLDGMQEQLDAEAEAKRKAEEEALKAEEAKRKADEEERKAYERRKELEEQFIPAIKADDIKKVKECLDANIGRYDYYVCSDYSTYRKMPHCPSVEMARLLIEDRLSCFWRFEEAHNEIDANRKQFIHDIVSAAIKDNPDKAGDYVQILKDYKAIKGYKTSDAAVYPIAAANGCDKQCFDFKNVVHKYYKAKDGYHYNYGPYGDYEGFMPSDFEKAKEIKKDLKYVLANGYRPDTSDKDSETYKFINELLKEREVERHGGVICSHDKDGDLHGNYEVYDDKGNIIKECIYWHGKLDGNYEERDASGNITKKCTYTDGKLDGNYEERDASGNITKKCTYTDGKLNGEYEERDASGNVIKAQYKDDKLNGVYKEINSQGRIVVEKYYENGVDLTKKREALKRIASKRIEKEKQIEDKTGKHVILPKAKPMEKLFAKIAVKKNKEI